MAAKVGDNDDGVLNGDDVGDDMIKGISGESWVGPVLPKECPPHLTPRL